MSKYIMALDQGTTSCRAIVFNSAGKIVSMVQKEFSQIYPNTGWVEHDALEIWNTQLSVMKEVLPKANIEMSDVSAIGITNQRETAVVWDKNSGQPVYNAIVWQSRQTAGICEEIKSSGHEEYVREATGLVVDAYFSGTKVKWILDKVPGSRERARKGELLFGTMDTWLIWKLTEGSVHVTEFGNASRTMMFNIRELKWDEKMLKILDVPSEMLPKVRNSSEIFGYVDRSLFGVEVPIGGAAGDQQAALFGQACFEKGMVKNTYGTGCFLLMQTGKELISSNNGLLTTISWGIDGKVEYALEGSVFMGGAVIQWLRDEFKLLDSAADSEYYASRVESSGGVYIVPAFSGLGAPYWDMYARGTIVGLTRGSGKRQIIRAALEAIAYQSRDLISAMEQDSGISLSTLKVDGGAVANNFLMQFQADILGVPVQRPEIIETTALGAAYLAGMSTGFWEDKISIQENWKLNREFKPSMENDKKEELYTGWKRAIDRSTGWIEK